MGWNCSSNRALYLVWWIGACAVVTWEWNVERQIEYFRMAWTGRAGEKPAVAWQLSILGTAVSAVVIEFLTRRSRRNRAKWQL
jgi:hypothetical protein